MVRVYFNARDAQFPWCVDHGFGTPEIQGKRIFLNVPAVSKLDKDAPHGSPSGWLEAANGSHCIMPDDEILVMEEPKPNPV